MVKLTTGEHAYIYQNLKKNLKRIINNQNRFKALKILSRYLAIQIKFGDGGNGKRP